MIIAFMHTVKGVDFHVSGNFTPEEPAQGFKPPFSSEFELLSMKQMFEGDTIDFPEFDPYAVRGMIDELKNHADEFVREMVSAARERSMD